MTIVLLEKVILLLLRSFSQIPFVAIGGLISNSLDQSRVVQLSNGERTYHIFYELCAGASPILKGNIPNRIIYNLVHVFYLFSRI